MVGCLLCATMAESSSQSADWQPESPLESDLDFKDGQVGFDFEIEIMRGPGLSKSDRTSAAAYPSCA